VHHASETAESGALMDESGTGAEDDTSAPLGTTNNDEKVNVQAFKLQSE
jgi:hypothetical protein